MDSELSNRICAACGNFACDIPFGICHCGCKEFAPVAKWQSKKRGHVKGMPHRYVRGHDAILYRPDMSGAKAFKIDGVYCRLISLPHGYYAIVWESDYDRLMQWRWIARRDKGGKIYATRYEKDENGKQYPISMQFEIMPAPKGLEVDHISGVSLDNRRSNLRHATRQQQTMNRCVYKNNTTGFKGVTREGNGFRADIQVGKKRIYLGNFKTAESAYAAYCAAAQKYFGEFARADYLPKFEQMGVYA